MLDKHVHALNLLIISMIMSNFRGRVRVWRLILKKNSSEHRNAPCGAGAFRKISDDDCADLFQKIIFLTQRHKDAEILFLNTENTE
jgi:hypothetical protein